MADGDPTRRGPPAPGEQSTAAPCRAAPPAAEAAAAGDQRHGPEPSLQGPPEVSGRPAGATVGESGCLPSSGGGAGTAMGPDEEQDGSATEGREWDSSEASGEYSALMAALRGAKDFGEGGGEGATDSEGSSSIGDEGVDGTGYSYGFGFGAESEAALTEIPSDVVRLTARDSRIPADKPTVSISTLLARVMWNRLSVTKREVVLPERTLKGFARHLRTCRNVVVMVGAGISVAAGIPDFRTQGTGLYFQLEKFNLPEPEAIFSLNYFRAKPHAFYRFAEELWPGTYKPTKVHRFMRLLQDQGVLRRVYTQNIDGLERQAGVEPRLLVEAHGHMASAHCVDCHAAFPASYVKNKLEQRLIPFCPSCRADGKSMSLDEADPTPDESPAGAVQSSSMGPGGWPFDGSSFLHASAPAGYKGLVKPKIVFFGESLPSAFVNMSDVDFPAADALIIIGTSLKVAPFCHLPCLVSPSCPRLFINREVDDVAARAGFVLSDQYGYRDVTFDGDGDDGIDALLAELGWTLPEESVAPSANPVSEQSLGEGGEGEGRKRPREE
ncbi:NAD-dependent protein deacetylase Sirt2 [Diplonema papillatum]|nr:NAD-dependent protein deacetylase Sirt2 [Diplonema papillatum]